VNRVHLAGRLVAAPRRLEGRGVLVELMISTDSPDAQAHRIIAWGQAGLAALKFLTTGRFVAVEGRLRTTDGRLEVLASRVSFPPAAGEA
jgi:single-stranded DNA-binding protein